MKKNKIYFILLIAAMAASSAVSYNAGKKTVENEYLAANVENTASKKESTQIAIVNQDMGITYNDKEVNYALDFMKSLDGDFVVTNREGAKMGVMNGKYGAMIILPGDFSKNIVTINDVTPSKVEIYYETSQFLNKENELSVLGKIADFEKKLNNKLSYMYVCSVFDEIHRGQDSASEILRNDDKDLEAIDSINGIDILNTINLTGLEKEDIQIEDLNLTRDFADNKRIISQIDDIYRRRILSEENDMDAVKERVNTLLGDGDESIYSFKSKIEAMDPEELKKELATRRKFNYGDLSQYYDTNKDEINKYIDDLIKDNGTIDSIIDNYNSSTLSNIKNKGEKVFKDYDEHLSHIKERSDESSKLLNDDISSLKGLDRTLKRSFEDNDRVKSLNEEYLLYSQIVQELIKKNPSEFDNIYNDISKKYNVDFEKILKDPTDYDSASNTFENAVDFKGYIQNPTKNFELERSSKYKGIDYFDKIINECNQTINDAIKALEKADNNLKDQSQKAGDISNDEDYKYMKDFFTFKEKEELTDKLKIKDNLTSGLKENIGSENQKELIKRMEKNNRRKIDEVEGRIEVTVQKNLKDTKEMDLEALFGIFKERYLGRFDGLLEKVNKFDKSPASLDEDTEIKNIYKSYDNSAERIQKSIDIKLEEYKKLFGQVNDKANKQFENMQTMVEEGVKQSQEKIEESLENAKNVKAETASLNKVRLRALSGVLSNSRLGTIENSDVYKFMVNPACALKNEDK